MEPQNQLKHKHSITASKTSILAGRDELELTKLSEGNFHNIQALSPNCNPNTNLGDFCT